MKIEVITGQVYSGNKAAANPGDVIDLPDAEAQRLVTLGVAKKPGAASAPEPPAKTEAEIAAEKRKKMEEAAVEKGLGTAAEVAEFTDEELREFLKAAKEREKAEAEAKAVKDGLATADEVGKLSDEELFALVKDK